MIRTQSVLSTNGKSVVGRILPGVQLFEGIQQICEQYHIKYGVITALLGSLRAGSIVCVMENEESPLGISYSQGTIIEGPLEILSGQGMIGRGEEDEFQIHLHGLMVDKNLTIHGGHFIPEGNRVLATVEIMIQIVEDGEFLRKFDEETGFPLFHFIQNS